jgi:uncharacterized protein YjdB
MVRSAVVRSIAALGMLCGILAACDQRQAVDPGNRSNSDRFLVSISPERDSLLVGASLGLTAIVVDARGAARSDRVVRWSSLAPDIASVDSSGLVTGVAAGIASIAAKVGSGAQTHADTATILVQAGILQIAPEFAEIALGDSLRLHATLGTSDGDELRNLSVRWSTSNQTIAQVSSDGVVASISPGDAIVTASVNGMSANALVRVQPNPIYGLSVSPANAGLYPGDTARLVASARNARGQLLSAGNVQWSSSATSVAAVSTNGLVHALATGSTIVTAAVEGRKASATVTVYSVPAAAVSVTAPASTVTQGGRLQAVATARDAEGNALSGKRVAWSSSNPAVAQINADGTITGLTVGSTSIHAIIDSKIGTLPILVVSSTATTIGVLPATAVVSLGKTAQLTAEVHDQGGNLVSSVSPAWASSNQSVATVSSNGLVTAVGLGTADISATTGGLSAHAALTVISARIASVSVSPNASQIQIGAAMQLSAVVTADSGSSVPNAAVAWSSSNPAVVTVSASGLATGVGAGSAIVTATSSGISGVASVAVSSPPPVAVAKVVVTFNSLSLIVGQGTQALAVASDANGQAITGRTVAWSSDDAAIASVSATGLVTAIGGGTATIIATIDGVIGFATISIGAPTPLPVHVVQLTIAPITISAGQTAISSVVLRDSLGGRLFGRTIGWSSSRPNVASVGLGGVVTGIGAGTTVITATSEGKSAAAGVTVVSSALPSVATITVATTSVRLTPGQSTQATATARDSAGNVLAGVPVTWLSSTPAAATVSPTGLVTAIAQGASTVTATASGKSGSVVITVFDPATTGANVPVSIDASGTADVTDALTAFFASVADGTTIGFPGAQSSRRRGAVIKQPSDSGSRRDARRSLERH